MAKVIAVLGATGGQGGGLCRAILADPGGGFSCRAVTRDPIKDKAKALATAGAEVVAADLDDVESLKKAFAGVDGVFGVTNFWEHFSGEKEKAQAKNIADAAKAAGVKHVIWSTLEDTRWVRLPDDREPRRRPGRGVAVRPAAAGPALGEDPDRDGGLHPGRSGTTPVPSRKCRTSSPPPTTSRRG